MRAWLQEHVQNCRTSAQHAVASMLDPSTGDYDYLPYFYSRIFNLSWQARAVCTAWIICICHAYFCLPVNAPGLPPPNVQAPGSR